MFKVYNSSPWLLIWTLVSFSVFDIVISRVLVAQHDVFDLETAAAEPRPVMIEIEKHPVIQSLPLVYEVGTPLTDASEKVEKVLKRPLAFSYNSPVDQQPDDTIVEYFGQVRYEDDPADNKNNLREGENTNAGHGGSITGHQKQEPNRAQYRSRINEGETNHNGHFKRKRQHMNKARAQFQAPKQGADEFLERSATGEHKHLAQVRVPHNRAHYGHGTHEPVVDESGHIHHNHGHLVHGARLKNHQQNHKHHQKLNAAADSHEGGSHQVAEKHKGDQGHATADVQAAASGHHGHHKKEHHDKKHEKGGGKEHHAEHHGDHEEKGEKGYEGHHKYEKKEKGHHDKEGHKGKFHDAGDHHKEHHEEHGHFGEHHEGEKGEKGSKYEEEGEHSKGHSTKGEHNVHKKDEYEKKHEFYDEHHEGGEHEKHGGYDHHHDYKKGGHEKAHHKKGKHHHEDHGKEGHHEKGHHHSEHKGHKDDHGHDKHHHHHQEEGEKEHKGHGKKWHHKKDNGGGGGGHHHKHHDGHAAGSQTHAQVHKKGDGAVIHKKHPAEAIKAHDGHASGSQSYGHVLKNGIDGVPVRLEHVPPQIYSGNIEIDGLVGNIPKLKHQKKPIVSQQSLPIGLDNVGTLLGAMNQAGTRRVRPKVHDEVQINFPKKEEYKYEDFREGISNKRRQITEKLLGDDSNTSSVKIAPKKNGYNDHRKEESINKHSVVSKEPLDANPSQSEQGYEIYGGRTDDHNDNSDDITGQNYPLEFKALKYKVHEKGNVGAGGGFPPSRGLGKGRPGHKDEGFGGNC